MAEKRISVSGLDFCYPGEPPVLEAIDLEVAAGEFLVLIGPSGCGKSTLLRLISRLETPVRGSVDLNAKRLAHVFQSPALFPWQTVIANVVEPLRAAGVSANEARDRAAAALDRVGLADSAKRYPHQLSGGMAQRVSIARALVQEPQILLMDEPFGALDELTREKMNEDLLELTRDSRAATVFVTHSVSEAVFLSSRIAVMSHRPGKIAAWIDNPLGDNRNAAIRGTAAFGKCEAQVRDALRAAAGSKSA